MAMYSNFGNYNIVRDYNKVQGTTHPSDLSYQIIRDYHVRQISIQNSDFRPIGCAITTYMNGPTPPILFTLAGGEIKTLAINPHTNGPPQWLWLLNTETKQPVGPPSILQNNSNTFVIRQGLNKTFVHNFSFPSYSAAK